MSYILWTGLHDFAIYLFPLQSPTLVGLNVFIRVFTFVLMDGEVGFYFVL